MTQTERKVIRAKVGLLELAKQLGNVTQACRVIGYPRRRARDTPRSMSGVAARHARLPLFASSTISLLLPRLWYCGQRRALSIKSTACQSR
jgi:hypothetical protein